MDNTGKSKSTPLQGHSTVTYFKPLIKAPIASRTSLTELSRHHEAIHFLAEFVDMEPSISFLLLGLN